MKFNSVPFAWLHTEMNGIKALIREKKKLHNPLQDNLDNRDIS